MITFHLFRTKTHFVQILFYVSSTRRKESQLKKGKVGLFRIKQWHNKL